MARQAMLFNVISLAFNFFCCLMLLKTQKPSIMVKNDAGIFISIKLINVQNQFSNFFLTHFFNLNLNDF